MESKKFRLNTKTISITMPQCTATKHECLEAWQNKCGSNLIDYLIVKESHEDGEPHIHAFLELETRCNWHTANCLDVGNFHGNYQTTKSKQNWIEYLLKEDKEPLQSREWDNWLELSKNHKKRDKNLTLLEDLKTKGPLGMLHEGSINPLMFPNWQKAHAAILREEEIKKNENEKDDIPASIENPWGLQLQVDTDKKQCHFWLFSSMPNLGKTTWATELSSKYRVAFFNYGNNFQGQVLPSTEILILDEYRGQLKVTEINQICDGSYWYQEKNLPAWKLNQKPIVIILANRSPSQIYKKMEDISLIAARFRCICLDKYKKEEEKKTELIIE